MDYYDENDSNSNNYSEDTSNQKQFRQYNGADRKPTNGMALISMVCGIVGLLALCGCISFPISIILGVAAISLSILSKKGMPFCGLAIAGLVLGILSLIFGFLEGIYIIAVNYILQDPDMMAYFNQMLEQYGGQLQ